MTQTSPKSNAPDPIASESLFEDMDIFSDTTTTEVPSNGLSSDDPLLTMETSETEAVIISDWGLEPGQVNPSEPLSMTTEIEDFRGLEAPIAEVESGEGLQLDSWNETTEVPPTIFSAPATSSEEGVFALVPPNSEPEEPKEADIPVTFSTPILPKFSAVNATPVSPPKISTFTPPPASFSPSPLTSPLPPVSETSWWRKQSFRSQA
ncbi:MAG: hypothetical protein ACRC6M_02585, partial [Microcystaceae cyanobacterium]